MLPLKTLAHAVAAMAPLALVGAVGCGLFESAQSDKVLAATVLATPAYDLSAALPDAGLPFDSGIPLPSFDAGGLTTVPAQTVAQVFFGQRDPDPTRQPKGIAGATATLSIGSKTHGLVDRGEGNYSLTTLEDATLLFAPAVPYDVAIVSGGATYTAKVDGPAADAIEQFRALAGRPLEQDAKQGLQLTRQSTDNVAFTTVVPITASGQGQPSYTDMPTKPLDLLDLIANDAPWKRKVISIPASAFPDANTYYAVTIASVKRGETSTNLFTASAFLVGKADLGLVKTR